MEYCIHGINLATEIYEIFKTKLLMQKDKKERAKLSSSNQNK